MVDRNHYHASRMLLCGGSRSLSLFVSSTLLLLFPYEENYSVPFVCLNGLIWYRDRVGRREPAVPRVHEGRVKTWRPAGRVPPTRTVTRARQPASSETGSWTRLPPSSASTSPSGGSTSTRAPPGSASRSTTTSRAWRRWSSA